MGSGTSIPEAGLTLEDARQLVPADEWVDEWDTRFAEPKVVSKRTAERVWAKKERLAPPGAVAAPARSAPTRAPEDRAIAVSAHAEEFFRMAAGFLASKKKLDAVAASMARLDAVKAVAPFAAAGAPVQTSDLNRDGAICLDDVYGAARGARGAFEALVRRVAAAAGLDEEHALLPGLKGKERCLEKVFKEYDGEFRRLCDVLRASLVAATEAQLVGVCDALLASGAVLRLKNRFRDPPFNGYRDLLFSCRVAADGEPACVAEVQVHYAPALARADFKSSTRLQLKAYATLSLRPRFETSTRAIDSSKNEPYRLRCDRAREV